MSDAYKQWLAGPEAREILQKAALAKWNAMSATEKAPFELQLGWSSSAGAPVAPSPSRTALSTACGPQFFFEHPTQESLVPFLHPTKVSQVGRSAAARLVELCKSPGHRFGVRSSVFFAHGSNRS